MPAASINKTFSLPGYTTLTASISRSGESAIAVGGADAPITLNAAKQMSDYAEGAANEITGNLTAGHGLTTGTFDFYWQESGVNKCRYGVAVTVNVNAISTTSAGNGDDFPTTPDAQPVLCKQKTVNVSFDGDDLSVFWAALLFGNVSATGRGHAAFQESAGTAVGHVAIGGITLGTAVADYDITGGASNPLSGNAIAKVQVSHNDTTYTPTFQFAALIGDSTP